jgi:predicted GNAT family acetyltransferase
VRSTTTWTSNGRRRPSARCCDATTDEELAAKLDDLEENDLDDNDLDGGEPNDQARFDVVDVRAAARFELQRDGETVGFAVYREQEGSLVVSHVETLVAHRNQGYGDRLMQGIVAIVRHRELTIVPRCWFAAGFLRDHPEHHDVLHERR